MQKQKSMNNLSYIYRFLPTFPNLRNLGKSSFIVTYVQAHPYRYKMPPLHYIFRGQPDQYKIPFYSAENTFLSGGGYLSSPHKIRTRFHRKIIKNKYILVLKKTLEILDFQ